MLFICYFLDSEAGPCDLFDAFNFTNRFKDFLYWSKSCWFGASMVWLIWCLFLRSSMLFDEIFLRSAAKLRSFAIISFSEHR